MSTAATDLALGDIALFRGLKPEELARLSVLLRRQSFPATTRVIHAEQPGEVAYVLVDGAVKVQVEDDEGVDVILTILGPGEVLGEMSVVDSLGRSATVVTLEESSLLWIDRGTFWECLRAMPTLTYNLANILSRRLRLANARIEALATLDVYARVARHLLALAQEYGEAADGDRGAVRVPFRWTQVDLAALTGASRVRVNQVLVAYKQRGYISVDSAHHITVHDPMSLARRAR